MTINKTTTRSTIYFDSSIHEALRMKAAATHQSLSALVNEAVSQLFTEDQEDLAIFKQREKEPTISYEELLNDLKAHGKI